MTNSSNLRYAITPSTGWYAAFRCHYSFNGTDVNKEWEDSRGNPTKWVVQDGALACVKGSGVVQTKRKFNIFSCILNGSRRRMLSVTDRGRGTAVYTFRVYTRYRS